MNKITLTYPYYDNGNMLKRQIDVWNSYPAELRDRFEVIVVDDCSQIKPATRYLSHVLFNFKVYRLSVNVPWNQTAARNLAAYEAKNEWLFMTDIDHVLDAENFIKLFKWLDNGNANKKVFYTFNRVSAPDMIKHKVHPNSYFMHNSIYKTVGGYDEEYSGKVYATDGMFRRDLKGAGFRDACLKHITIIRYGREVIADASTTEFKRGRDFQSDKVRTEVKDRVKQKHIRKLPPRVLSFPWERKI